MERIGEVTHVLVRRGMTWTGRSGWKGTLGFGVVRSRLVRHSQEWRGMARRCTERFGEASQEQQGKVRTGAVSPCKARRGAVWHRR